MISCQFSTGITRMWEAAQVTDEAKRSFKNGVLDLTWVETVEAPVWQRLYERREPHPRPSHVGNRPAIR
jgi:hypothetical protein